MRLEGDGAQEPGAVHERQAKSGWYRIGIHSALIDT